MTALICAFANSLASGPGGLWPTAFGTVDAMNTCGVSAGGFAYFGVVATWCAGRWRLVDGKPRSGTCCSPDGEFSADTDARA